MATANENEFDSSKLLELGILGGLGAYGANQARKDANTQIQGLEASNNLFGPDSPYAKQLRQNLERRDAADGRRSQYGPREVELQAKLAEMNAGQASRNAPTLNALYQQRQGATSTAGKDFASILAASGGLKKLSPMVQNLFKRRVLEDGDTIGSGSSYVPDTNSLNLNTAGTDSYGFGNDSFSPTSYDSYEPNFDFGSSGLDFGGYDSYASDFDAYSGGFDAATSGFDSAYEVDFGSLPGFAKGGPVNIFQALAKSRRDDAEGKGMDGGYKATGAVQVNPVRQGKIFEGPNDRQEFGRAASAANTASKIAGVKGGFLGPYSGIPGIFTANSAQERVGATGVAALTYINPILGAAASIAKLIGGGESKTPWAQQIDNYFVDGKIDRADEKVRGTSRSDILKGRLKHQGGFSDDQISRYLTMREENPEYRHYVEDPAYATERDAINKDFAAFAAEKQAAFDGTLPTEGAQTNFATGGPVRGPGTGTSDSIVARLSDGEYVNTADTVDSLGTALFDKLEAKAKRSTPEELKKFKAGLQALF